MKITFRKHLEKEEDEKGEEEKKMNRFIALVAYDLATEKRGLKDEGYRYIYFTNPLRHKNYRGNTYIWELDEGETWIELKYTYIGKRASFINGVLEFAEIDFKQSSEKELALLFNTKGKWIIDPERQKSELELLKLELYDYHTSTPKEWGMKWHEILKPCYVYDETEDGEEDGYYTKYDLDQLPVISSPGEEEEIKRDTERCAVIYDLIARKPRAIVPYTNIYIENPPWWVEEQLH